MTKARGRLTARRTGVLVVVVLSALVAALVLRDGPSGGPTSSRTATPAVEQDDATLSLGLGRLTSIEQPLSVWMRIADCEATPAAQLVVAERVLEQQGWEAWPVCSRKLGLR